MELRQIHARQRFGPLTVTGTKIDELYDPWFRAVYEIAPEVEGGMKMAPHGLIQGGIAGREKPVVIDLTGKSPLESLNLICKAFDAYFAYTEDFTVVVTPDKELKSGPSHTDDETPKDDPFASDGSGVDP